MTASSLLGKQIGNYVAMELIGQGGMGDIYLAEHPKIGRKVAIKVLGAHLSYHAEAAERFLAEARAVTRIVHPNVVDIYDFGSLEDGRFYYMMEVLKGQVLGTVMAEKGRMSCQEVLPYLEQICNGLQAAHDLGVIHRDLKPENIFVLEQQPLALKLLDFGIAKMLEGGDATRTSTGIVMGTPLFIAPEQAAGQPERVGRQTDLYSLGVILFYMLAGRPPFTEQITALLLAKHITEPPPPIQEIEPDVPDAIADLIDQCLEKEPSVRPSSAKAIAERFAAAVASDQAAPGNPAATSGGNVLSKQEKLVANEPAGSSPLTFTDRQSTLGGSAGEIPAGAELAALSEAPAKKIMLIAGGALVLAVVLGILFLRGGEKPGKEKTMQAASPAVSQANVQLPTPKEDQPAEPSGQPKVMIRVQRADPALDSLRCTFQIRGRDEVSVAEDGCTFASEGGQAVTLKVSHPQYEPLALTWVVADDREIRVSLDSRRRALIEQGSEEPVVEKTSPSAKTAPVATAVPVRPAKRAAAGAPAPKPAAKVTVTPQPKAARGAKKKPLPARRKVGEGTMHW